jgi:hypothetical protein
LILQKNILNMPRSTSAFTVCRLRSFAAFLLILLFFCPFAKATILNLGDGLKVDFTVERAAITNVVWAGLGLNVTTNGLGWDGERNDIHNFWVQSIPVAIGTAWRPAESCNVRMKMNFADSNDQFRFDNPYKEQQSTHAASCIQFYVRYSPDKLHWSTWQALDAQLQGLIDVPDVARVEYNNLLGDYAKQNVPWSSDEEAAAKWILQGQPDFFEKHIPFVGYVQFRGEGWIAGGQRIKQIEMALSWDVSGMATAPSRPNEVNEHNGPWRFDATKKAPH